MSSNTSQAKALSILHRAKVADYAAWSLFVKCRPCDAPRTVPLASLPPDLTIIQALMRYYGTAATNSERGLLAT